MRLRQRNNRAWMSLAVHWIMWSRTFSIFRSRWAAQTINQTTRREKTKKKKQIFLVISRTNLNRLSTAVSWENSRPLDCIQSVKCVALGFFFFSFFFFWIHTFSIENHLHDCGVTKRYILLHILHSISALTFHSLSLLFQSFSLSF